MSGMRYRQVEAAPASVIAGEAAVVTPSDSRLHLLNEVATAIWARCTGEGATRDEIVAHLLAEYDVDEETAMSEATAFLEEAVGSGLLEASAGG
jgi:hypothetical protein